MGYFTLKKTKVGYIRTVIWSSGSRGATLTVEARSAQIMPPDEVVMGQTQIWPENEKLACCSRVHHEPGCLNRRSPSKSSSTGPPVTSADRRNPSVGLDRSVRSSIRLLLLDNIKKKISWWIISPLASKTKNKKKEPGVQISLLD